MGEPDLQYTRVEDGRFLNPDTTLDDGPPPPGEVFFREFVEAEPANLILARLRQTLALCAFANEIGGFIRDRSTPNQVPFAADYYAYWQTRIDQYAARCSQARERFGRYSFTSQPPEFEGPNTLRLPFFLGDLPGPEQITSAETLLDRVLVNLALGEELLTDGSRLTRRGYRLPANVNLLNAAES